MYINIYMYINTCIIYVNIYIIYIPIPSKYMRECIHEYTYVYTYVYI